MFSTDLWKLVSWWWKCSFLSTFLFSDVLLSQSFGCCNIFLLSTHTFNNHCGDKEFPFCALVRKFLQIQTIHLWWSLSVLDSSETSQPVRTWIPKTSIPILLLLSRHVDDFRLKPGRKNSVFFLSPRLPPPFLLLSASLLEVKRSKTRGCGAHNRKGRPRPLRSACVWEYMRILLTCPCLHWRVTLDIPVQSCWWIQTEILHTISLII